MKNHIRHQFDITHKVLMGLDRYMLDEAISHDKMAARAHNQSAERENRHKEIAEKYCKISDRIWESINAITKIESDLRSFEREEIGRRS